MGICRKCGLWHSMGECPPPIRVTCACGNSFLMPLDCSGMIKDLTCGNCGKPMTEAIITGDNKLREI